MRRARGACRRRPDAPAHASHRDRPRGASGGHDRAALDRGIGAPVLVERTRSRTEARADSRHGAVAADVALARLVQPCLPLVRPARPCPARDEAGAREIVEQQVERSAALDLGGDQPHQLAAQLAAAALADELLERIVEPPGVDFENLTRRRRQDARLVLREPDRGRARVRRVDVARCARSSAWACPCPPARSCRSSMSAAPSARGARATGPKAWRAPTCP